jgi:hypothetical protein
MNFEDYKKIPGINWSGLKHMRRSPMHYRYRLQNPTEDSNRLALGRGCHTAVFEPDKFLTEYALFKGKIRRGKAWEAFKEQHAEDTILKRDEYDRVLAIRDAVRKHKKAQEYLEHGAPEQVLTWTDRETGLACKARIDWLCHAVVDLKSTSDVDATRFATQVARMLYHAQLAFYVDGVREVTGEEKPAVIISAEIGDEHDVAVFRLNKDDLETGRAEYRSLLVKVAECTEANWWPGRYPEEVELVLPRWARLSDEDDLDMNDFDEFVVASTNPTTSAEA